ncbi:MAG: three-Cys-motif partner protein TcmP [Bacteriovoracales bacterium]|nr:three-Cys-motif partner protein TcmP [Bacteriovoracales bacterium]
MAQDFGGKWTEQKLACLDNYLAAYKMVMKNQPFKLLYIDAFAGTGYRKEEVEDVKAFLKGSVPRALAHHFDRYIFIEKDQDKFQQLEDVCMKSSGLNIQMFNEDANDRIPKICDEIDWKEFRAVFFLDPFAMELKWDTLIAIAKTCAIDLWLLFPAMAVNRFLFKKGEQIPDGFKTKLNNLFGIDDWEKSFYQPNPQLSLFNGNSELEKTANFEEIKQFYLERLQKIFAGVASNPLQLKNSTGSTMFYLYFAVSNKGTGRKIALRIAQHILKGV